MNLVLDAGALISIDRDDRRVAGALAVLAAMPGEQVLTSDPDDLTRLADGRGLPVTVVRV